MRTYVESAFNEFVMNSCFGLTFGSHVVSLKTWTNEVLKADGTVNRPENNEIK